MTNTPSAGAGPAELELVGADRPSAARMYDYFLGGSSNFAVDRAAAERALAGFPKLADGMRANRTFLRRAVRFLAEEGIDQYLDLGSGIPTAGNVHEIVEQVNPRAHTVYVDIEPVAVEHARLLLEHNSNATIVQGDLRQPAELLANPAVHDLIDFNRPVAVLIVGTMHFISDADDPAAIVVGYRDALTPGGYFALTHGTAEGQEPAQTAATTTEYRNSPTPLHLREHAEVLALFDGFELVEPGLVAVHEWRPDQEEGWTIPFAWGGVGRKT
jgi:SAM-dependent methyltransferase